MTVNATSPVASPDRIDRLVGGDRGDANASATTTF